MLISLKDLGSCFELSLVIFALLVLFAKPFFLWIISSSHSFGVAEQTAVIRGASQPMLTVEVVNGCAGSQNHTRGIKKSPGFPFCQCRRSMCLR